MCPWEVWAPVNRFNNTSGVTSVTPTDRPKSVRNRCVIKVFWWRFYVVTMLFGISCGCMGVCHRTESDLFLFVFINSELLVDLGLSGICLKTFGRVQRRRYDTFVYHLVSICSCQL